ncbi:hypothetical protein BJY52DRAFT_1353966 [Lactarius psammicola]|nr:hypothetical protein BJY52DRAFT_1353966 [Lactarius psammicola]
MVCLALFPIFVSFYACSIFCCDKLTCGPSRIRNSGSLSKFGVKSRISAQQRQAKRQAVDHSFHGEAKREGYGTVSECVDSCTPFVYVSRPTFVEEHGLRLLLDREGAGVEMARGAYESGEWASAVSDAWRAGAQRKLERREGMHAPDRRSQGLQMARDVITWVNKWVAEIGLN